MRLAQRSAPNTHVDMSLLPTTKHLKGNGTTMRHFVFRSFFNALRPIHFDSLGVVRPVDAGGFIVGTVVTLVQHKGIKLTLLSRSVVHQSYVFLCDNKLPAREQTHSNSALFMFDFR